MYVMNLGSKHKFKENSFESEKDVINFICNLNKGVSNSLSYPKLYRVDTKSLKIVPCEIVFSTEDFTLSVRDKQDVIKHQFDQ